MRLHLILPRVDPAEVEPPDTCPYEDCDGTCFRFHQAVEKPLRDTEYDQVTAHRYECLKCGRTFRVYPRGVTRAQTSLRVKGLGVIPIAQRRAIYYNQKPTVRSFLARKAKLR
jgi:hypothetical protein